MKHKWLLFFIFALGCISLYSCSNPTPVTSRPKTDPGYHKKNYDSTILAAAQKCESCESWDGLFYDTAFVDLFQHGDYYIKDALAFISNARYNDIQKQVCINSLQKAWVEDYVKVISRCKELFDTDKISEYILSWSVNPNFSKVHLIVKNFRNASVRQVLTDIRNDKKVSPNQKEVIGSILSGDLWDSTREQEGL